MSVALAGRSPTSFEIKSASLPLLALRLKSADLDTLAAELAVQYGDKPGFFEDDALVIDLSALPGPAPADEDAAPPPPIDFERLSALLREHRLRPLAVRGGHSLHMAAAQQAGLLAAPEALVQAAPRPPAEQAAAPEPAPQALPEPGALIIERPLRSGQQAYARGRDLVVMAMVNPGAEVIADGHIHVYAPLRGRAIAGARGWPGARIFARDMRPELVSIAGVYRTSEDPLPESVWGKAATLRLQSTEAGDKLIFEPVAG
ncbi:MAG: septum site-determining protein MinC [Pseudomonadota bacterium]|nr:septum site-determining protein MinC [Pseudomonadota bacterium]